MEGNYPVSFGGKDCGKVQVTRQGLYYRILCYCRITGDVLCRLVACWDGRREDFGIVIPMDGCFGMDTRVPVKRMGTGRPVFCLQAGRVQKTQRFVPIFPEEPFAYLSRLKESYLVHQNGQAGILVE